MNKLIPVLLAMALPVLAENINVVWEASPSPGVTGYRVYSSTNNGLTWKLEAGVNTLNAIINATTNTTTVGVADTNSVGAESALLTVDLLASVKNLRVNGNTISWDPSPFPTSAYNVLTSSNLVNWFLVTINNGRTNTTVTIANMPASIVAVGVRSTSTNSISLRATTEILKPVTNMRILGIDQ